MKIYFLICISFLFSIDLNEMPSVYSNNSFNPNSNNIQTNTDSRLNSNTVTSLSNAVNKNLVLFESVDPKTYIVGAGDTFLFNMIIPNRTINVELISSPTSTILIPGIGLISVKGITLEQTYAKIIETCKKTHEDAYVYVNIFKLRQFKVLVSGNSRYAGMYPVFATYRVSGLWKISFGVPICSIRPLFITTILSASVIASTWSCVT